MNGRTILIAGAAALALTTGGCRFGHHFGGRHAAADTGAIKEAIKADEKKWNDEFQAKPMNVDALMAHYAPDAYFVAPGLKHASGTADIRKQYEGFARDPNGSISFASDKIDVAASGDIAYSRGRYSEKYTDPKTNKVVTDSGSYITVFKKQPDGGWKAAEDFTASEPVG